MQLGHVGRACCRWRGAGCRRLAEARVPTRQGGAVTATLVGQQFHRVAHVSAEAHARVAPAGPCVLSRHDPRRRPAWHHAQGLRVVVDANSHGPMLWLPCEPPLHRHRMLGTGGSHCGRMVFLPAGGGSRHRFSFGSSPGPPDLSARGFGGEKKGADTGKRLIQNHGETLRPLTQLEAKCFAASSRPRGYAAVWRRAQFWQAAAPTVLSVPRSNGSAPFALRERTH